MKKVGFVLTGEGSRGAHQAAVLAKLSAENIRPDFISGVSSGAINAAAYSMLGPYGNLRIWQDIEGLSDLFSFNWKFLWENGIFTSQPIRKKLLQFAKEDTDIPFAFPVTSAKTGEATWLNVPKGTACEEFIDALISAVTIPCMVRSENGLFDGGAVTLCPLKPAIEAGCDTLYVIMGRSPLQASKFIEQTRFPFLSYGYRFIDLLMHNLLLGDLTRAVEINELVKSGKSERKVLDIKIVYPTFPLYDALGFKHCLEMTDLSKYPHIIHSAETLLKPLGVSK